MLKTMKELDGRKIIRRMENSHPQAALEAATQSLKDEAATELQEQKNAKRTQFAPADTDITTFIKKDYGNNSRPEPGQKQSQPKPFYSPGSRLIPAEYSPPGVPGSTV